MQIYCQQVSPKWRLAITPFKYYNVIAEDELLKVIKDDEGDFITVSLFNCQFLGGGSWVIIEV